MVQRIKSNDLKELELARIHLEDCAFDTRLRFDSCKEVTKNCSKGFLIKVVRSDRLGGTEKKSELVDFLSSQVGRAVIDSSQWKNV